MNVRPHEAAKVFDQYPLERLFGRILSPLDDFLRRATAGGVVLIGTTVFNPAMLAKYRQAFTPSRAKDDPTDAELQLELLIQHRGKLQPLKPQGASMRRLQLLVEQRRGLVDDRVRITNRLTYALKQYFPHALQWFKDKDTAVFCAFLSRWPMLKQAQHARKATLEAFFPRTQCTLPQHFEARIRPIKSAIPLTSRRACRKQSESIRLKSRNSQMLCTRPRSGGDSIGVFPHTVQWFSC